jgi:hypothetical protein
MSETQTKNPRMDDPFSGGMSFGPQSSQALMAPVAGATGGALDRAQAQIVTAQRVAIKRNLPAILAEAKALATAAERKFYYSMPFKERSKGDKPERTVYVEGPSIGCAMAAIGAYGNCSVEAFPASETPSHWTFMARFVDYEKGTTYSRSFNQRKAQNTGMRDAGRQEDIIFQIGQSKSIRNVIVGGLKWLTDEMFLAAKSGVLERIANNPDGARGWLAKQYALREIELKRVERVVGRPAGKWLAADMAKLFAELSALDDGFADADDLYPASVSEGEDLAEDRARQAANEATAASAAASTDNKAPPKKRTAAPRPAAEAPNAGQDKAAANNEGPRPGDVQQAQNNAAAQNQNQAEPAAKAPAADEAALKQAFLEQQQRERDAAREQAAAEAVGQAAEGAEEDDGSGDAELPGDTEEEAGRIDDDRAGELSFS